MESVMLRENPSGHLLMTASPAREMDLNCLRQCKKKNEGKSLLTPKEYREGKRRNASEKRGIFYGQGLNGGAEGRGGQGKPFL